MWQRARCFLLMVVMVSVTNASLVVAAHGNSVYPAHLHQGSCETLGAVALTLNAVGAETTHDGSPVPARELIGAAVPVPVLQSATTLAVPFSELVEDQHALVVSEVGTRTSRVIACGEVGGLLTTQMTGMVMPGDELAIGLSEVDGSGYAGIALVTAEGLSTTIRIYLAQGLIGEDLSPTNQSQEEVEGTPATR